MAFKDLREFLDPTLRLPIGGKEYVIPAPSASAGLRLEALLALGVAARNGVELSKQDKAALRLDDDQEIDLYRDALGTAYDEMVADGVSLPELQHAGATAFIKWTQGEAAAEAFWESGGKGPAAPATLNRAARRALAATSTGTAAATTTKRPARGSGTTSRPKSSRASKARSKE